MELRHSWNRPSFPSDKRNLAEVSRLLHVRYHHVLKISAIQQPTTNAAVVLSRADVLGRRNTYVESQGFYEQLQSIRSSSDEVILNLIRHFWSWRAGPAISRPRTSQPIADFVPLPEYSRDVGRSCRRIRWELATEHLEPPPHYPDIGVTLFCARRSERYVNEFTRRQRWCGGYGNLAPALSCTARG